MMKRDKKLAEALDQQLEGDSQNGGNLNPELRELQETAAWLRAQKEQYNPRPGYVASTRGYIEAQIFRGNQSRRDRLPILRRRVVYRSIWTLVIVLGLFLLSNGVALAAESALPGEGLYQVNMLIEATRLALTIDPIHDAALRIQFAQEHLVE